MSTTSLASGDTQCPNGGTRIDTGIDDGSNGGTAGNGALESGEITSTQYVCNGSRPATALLRSTTLAFGDADCPSGGTRTDAGIDDGAGGGIAGDGVLQEGEVSSTSFACNSGTLNVGSFDPPAGAPGNYSIQTRGGSAGILGSTGGRGGDFDVHMVSGSGGGHVKLFETGLVDASFAWPPEPTSFDYGPTPLEIATGDTVHVKLVANLTDAVDLTGSDLVAGDIVLPSACGWGFLYRWSDTTTQVPITGIFVGTGATLFFDHDDTACETRQFYLDYVFVNEGTVRTGKTLAGTSPGLDLQLVSYFGGPASIIDLRGESRGVGAPGGNGGPIQIAAIRNDSWGSFWNRGVLDTSGGQGDPPGRAGGVIIGGDGSVYNGGEVLARGGDAATLDQASSVTSGASGTVVILQSGTGGLYNSATIDVSGGAGSTTGGGAAFILLRVGLGGDLRNTGDLYARGGDADARCETGCSGGAGGNISLQAGGNLFTSGDLRSHGGNGRKGQGGRGAPIAVQAKSGRDDNTVNSYTLPGGAIAISGNLDSHGGDGATGGGQGGSITITSDPFGIPIGQEITLLGYGSGLDTSGGDGWGAGGDAGVTKMYQGGCSAVAGSCLWPAGSVISYVDVTSRGGDATASGGTGGAGGYSERYTLSQTYAVGALGAEQLINHGEIDVSGGSGGQTAGSAGFVWWYGMDGLENGGNVVADAGNATAADGAAAACSVSTRAGAVYGIQLLADRGALVNAGSLSNDGGSSTAVEGAGTGGNSGGIHLEGPTVDNTGDLSAEGGGSNTTAGIGGNGANVVLQSTAGATSTTGMVQTAGGAGSDGNEGTDGLVIIDGQMR